MSLRIIDFADGYTSSQQPTPIGVIAGSQDIQNNQVSALDLTDFLFDSTNELKVNVSYHIYRKSDAPTELRESGEFVIFWDGSQWQFNLGTTNGDVILEKTLSLSTDVALSISNNANVGQLQYTSGNVTGANYEGKINYRISKVTA